MKIHQNRQFITSDQERIDFVSDIYQCPVCLALSAGKTIYSFEGFEIVCCRFCGVRHLAPLPNDHGLFKIYNSQYYNDKFEQQGYKNYGGNERIIKKTYARRFKKLKSLLQFMPKIGTVHEIGCALGYGLEVAKDAFDAEISGSDISLEAVEACRKKRFVCYHSNMLGIHEIENSAKIDLIYMFDVIEHLKNIPDFIKWIADITSNRAALALVTPDMDSLFNKILGKKSPSVKIPQHVIYFTTKTLVKAFENTFELIGLFPDYQYFSVDIIVERLRHIFGLPHRTFNRFQDYNVLIPTGMKLYIFKKCCNKDKQ